MKKIFLSLLIASALVCSAKTVTSPNGNIVVECSATADGRPCYSVSYKNKPVVLESTLGFHGDEMQATNGFIPSYGEIVTFDETWNPVWGEYAEVRNHYNEMPVTFSSTGDKSFEFTVRFRVYDDGLGFRYEIPEQQSLNYLTLKGEDTFFNMAEDYTLFCIPGDYDTDEYLFTTTPFSALEENLSKAYHSDSAIPTLAVQTPLMMKSPSGVYVNLHEAALVGYPTINLDADPANLSFKTHLTPDKLGVAGYLQAPFQTPWRTLIISDDARDILASQLIFNLNEPCRIADTSWIKPQKFIGVWWEMFTGRQKTWAYSDKYNAKPGVTDYAALPSNGRHPANTENVMRYIDFAAESGIPAVLVEGWNEGWEDWAAYKKNRQFLFDKPYPDFDLPYLRDYAASKGVKLIMHHETAGNAADYERQLENAFRFMVDNGYNSVKTGYVGPIIPRSEHHSSQWMNDHYIHVVERAADYGIMVDSHEAVRPTGLCRTWPNWLAQESARGGEYESMGGNTPEHTVILPFTRLKGGPMDYTPGLFQTDLSYYGEGKTEHGGTTLARQLALYLTMPSPIQMACDLPENYRRFPDAFQFIKDVPVDWQNSVYLEAEPAEYITVARKDKNSDDWYVGAITDEKARTANINLSFLPKDVKFVATVYADGKDADWLSNPQSYQIYDKKVDNKTVLRIPLAAGGGCAIRLTPVTSR